MPCIKIGIVIILMSVFSSAGVAQREVGVDEIILQALGNSPVMKISTKQVERNQMLEKSALNLTDPQLILESPSGNFMALGIEQSFEFPTVYARQKQLAHQQTLLSAKSKEVSEAALKRTVKQAYLDWQYNTVRFQQQNTRDSLFAEIARTASRQFEAGQIDFVQKTYAEAQFTSTHAAWLSSRSEMDHSLRQIHMYTGLRDNIMPSPFIKMVDESVMALLTVLESSPEATPMMEYNQQRESYAEKAIQLEKSKTWPDLKIGYLNPAERNTPVGLRMRFGISVPIWLWQYKANVNAAKAQYEITKQESDIVRQEWLLQWNESRNEALKNYSILTYYETNGLAQADEMIQASGRMFEAGAYDFIRYLTTVSDAYRIREEYLDAVYGYNQSIIELQYLIGQ